MCGCYEGKLILHSIKRERATEGKREVRRRKFFPKRKKLISPVFKVLGNKEIFA